MVQTRNRDWADLKAVAVHAVVHVVDVGVYDVAVHVGRVENLGIALVDAEAAHLAAAESSSHDQV